MIKILNCAAGDDIFLHPHAILKLYGAQILISLFKDLWPFQIFSINSWKIIAKVISSSNFDDRAVIEQRWKNHPLGNIDVFNQTVVFKTRIDESSNSVSDTVPRACRGKEKS